MLFGSPPRALRARTRKRTRSITLDGSWTGEYGYDVPGRRGNVPFNATLNETEGALSGLIDEPNTFGHPSAPRLFASLDGTRNGNAIRFIKTYNGAGGVRHSVLYQGEANAALTRIDGMWTVSWLKGPFYMTRAATLADEEEIEGEAEAGA
jgi:hypothetical protein